MSKAEMQGPYVGTKTIMAAPMTKKEYCEYRGFPVPTDEDPEEEGYLVEYMDGGKPNDERHLFYISWSPKKPFDNAYKKMSDDPVFGEKSNRIAALRQVIHDLEMQWRKVAFLNGNEGLRPQQKPSRELALCITKIQEARHWVKEELDQMLGENIPASPGN